MFFFLLFFVSEKYPSPRLWSDELLGDKNTKNLLMKPYFSKATTTHIYFVIDIQSITGLKNNLNRTNTTQNSTTIPEEQFKSYRVCGFKVNQELPYETSWEQLQLNDIFVP